MFKQTFKSIDDVLWKDAGCTSELDRTEQTPWLLFLRYLDALEQDKAAEAELDEMRYTTSSTKPTAGKRGPRRKTPQARSSTSLPSIGSADVGSRRGAFWTLGQRCTASHEKYRIR